MKLKMPLKMEGNDCLISIVIPVKNGDYWLESTLEAIISQTLFDRSEIIIVDSGSTDRSLQILENFPVRLIQIEPSSFNHGLTRNLAVQNARGKYVVMTVQDARPSDNFWLENLLKGFIHENVAGVCGQQFVPHKLEYNPVQWFRPVSAPVLREVHFPDFSVFTSLSAEKQLDNCKWDDVNAMYKRDVLGRISFREVDFAEDALWARDALKEGYSLVYNPMARVEHYHFESPEYTFKRNFIERYFLYLYFNVKPSKVRFVDLFKYMLRTLKILSINNELSFSTKIFWFKHNYLLFKHLQDSDKLFIKALFNGSKELEDVYISICKSAPQASKIKL